MLEQDPSSVAAMQIAVAGLSLVVFFGALLEPIKAWRDQGRIAWPILRDSLPAAPGRLFFWCCPFSAIRHWPLRFRPPPCSTPESALRA